MLHVIRPGCAIKGCRVIRSLGEEDDGEDDGEDDLSEEDPEGHLPSFSFGMPRVRFLIRHSGFNLDNM